MARYPEIPPYYRGFPGAHDEADQAVADISILREGKRRRVWWTTWQKSMDWRLETIFDPSRGEEW